MFAYDARGRLIGEERSGEQPYHYEYAYDQGGNRTNETRHVDVSVRIEDRYHYDVDADPRGSYGSDNNRLMYYETYEVTEDVQQREEGALSPGLRVAPGTSEVLLSTTWYYYNETGNAVRVVTENEIDSPTYEATRLEYAKNGSAVTFVLGETWNEIDGQTVDYNIAYAREFGYDGARQRYMNAELDVDQLVDYGIVDPISTTWTDYAAGPGGAGAGDSVYGDFEMIGGAATDLRSFQPGMGKFDWSDVSPDTSSVEFYHGNQIGTTRFMTDSGGEGKLPATYTAFGERVDGTNHRYGYAGAYGYQTHDDVPFLHVGHRYYDPGSGRFLQRDPMGLYGGSNVHGYASSDPVRNIDPNGLHDGGPSHWKKWPEMPSPPPRGTPPHPHLTEEGAELTLELTGGEESWLDDKHRVGQVAWAFRIVGTCGLWLSGYQLWVKAVHRALTVASWAEEGHRNEYY